MIIGMQSNSSSGLPTYQDGYDVFLIAGQSNTYNGIAQNGEVLPDIILDSTDIDIQQWGRFDGFNGQVIIAEEPLDHIGYLGVRPPADVVGWALTFAKKYKNDGYLKGNRKLLLVPVGEGGSGFGDNKWNKGDVNYVDAVNRTNAALASGVGSNTLKGILWHQGEDDGGTLALATAHANALLAMIDNMRIDLGYPNVPFVAGGLVPSTLKYLYNQTVNDNIVAITTARTRTGYADPSVPTTLTNGTVDTVSNNHYSAYSMRGSAQNLNEYTTLGLAGRYWQAYLLSLTNI